MGIRLQKRLSELGVSSRRAAEQWILDGRIRVNNQLVTKLGTKVGIDDRIMVDNRLVTGETPPKVYWLFNKPKKTLCSHESNDAKSTIYQLASLNSLPFKINSVGRLDYMTEGLLLLTNDGPLIHRLTHPKYHVPRSYQVLISGRLDQSHIDKLKNNFMLPDGPVRKLDIKYLHQESSKGGKGSSWYYVTVYEGRNRLIRRIFESLEFPVQRLIRYEFGNVKLPSDLEVGQYRQLSAKEISYLKSVTSS